MLTLQVQPPIKCFPTVTRTYPLMDEVEYFSPLDRIMFARRVPECLLVLLTAPSTSVELGVFAAVRDLLLLFLTTQEGEFDSQGVIVWVHGILVIRMYMIG